MPSFRLQTLGSLSLRPADGDIPPDDDSEVVGPSKGLAVLAFLAATPGHEARRSYLADLLWPDAPLHRKRGSLRQALYYVRRRAGADLLRREGGRLALRRDRISVDLWELERAAEEGRWEEVIRLYRGPFVPEVPGPVSDEFRLWVRSVRERVAGRVGDARAGRIREGEPRPDAGDRARDGGAGLPGRHDWLSLLAPATVVAAGVAAAALLV